MGDPPPDGQTWCLTFLGYPMVFPSVQGNITRYVSPVVIFTDSVVFGGMPPLGHRLASVAANLQPVLGGFEGMELITDHVLKEDWEAMNEAILPLMTPQRVPQLTSQHVLDVLPNGYAVANSAFTKVTLSRKKGWLNPRVHIHLFEGRFKRREYRMRASQADDIAVALRRAFGERFELKGR